MRKGGNMEVEDTSENCSKKVKLQDLDSTFGTYLCEAQAGREGSNAMHQDDNSDSRKNELNVSVASVVNISGGDTPACIDEFNKPIDTGKEKMELDAEDISSSVDGPFYPCKTYENIRLREDPDYGSSLGPLDGKDSMWVWKGLKENNYTSTSHGSMQMPTQNPHGRKKNKNDDELKKQIQRAKKEKVDRLAKFVTPSGLLNGLNPGIINHVRNTKQVHSIIEALVKENKKSGSKQVSNIKSGTQELRERKEVESDLFICETTKFSQIPSQSHMGNVNAGLEVKLSTPTGATGNPSCLFNESANFPKVDSLSVEAANVASQWLELLSQDIRGRLAALKRSKKRIQSVITTELPFLISRESSSNVDKATFDSHSSRWRARFGQMEKTLSEEESRLESWLNQVKEMQLHCEKGLHRSSLYHASKQTGSIGNVSRSVEVDDSEKNLAVKAAAASIYSTCNFLLSMENQLYC